MGGSGSLISQTVKLPLESIVLGLGMDDPWPTEPPLGSGGYWVESFRFRWLFRFRRVVDRSSGCVFYALVQRFLLGYLYYFNKFYVKNRR